MKSDLLKLNKNNNADADAIAFLREEKEELLGRLIELEKDNKRLMRMVRILNQRNAYTSNINEVYARMIETNTILG